MEATAEAAGAARAGLDAPADLAVVFASARHLPMADRLLAEAQDRLGPTALIGCGAAGTLAAGRELEEGPGLAVWAASFPDARVTTFHVTAEREEEGLRLLGLPPDLSRGGEAGAMLVLADPYGFPTEALLGVLGDTRPGMPVLGGLASASAGGDGVLLRDGEVHGDGAVCALLEGVEVLPCVSQGAMPVGPEMTVTASEGGVIAELAGRPALERIGEVIEALPADERALAAAGVLLGIVIDENRPEYLRGDFLIRPIAGADRESGSLVIGRDVRVGQTIRLHVRDAASADRDLREALRAQSDALGAEGAAGALLFTCNGRGSRMFDVPDHDAGTLEDALGAPAAGFFCAGEIGPVGGRNFLHGFTATMAVFPAA